MDKVCADNPKFFIGLITIILGVGARFLVAYRGHNFDFESWEIVAQIFNSGGNVYAETPRYNYGPPWFHTLGLLQSLPQIWPFENPTTQFRYAVVGFLTIIDLLIFRFLTVNHGLKFGALFFLNPIGIIISGYHNQMDTMAILCGLYSMKIYENKSYPTYKYIGLIGIGFSLSIKHILFLLPIWLAFKEKRFEKIILAILIPYLIFLVSFIPYTPEGISGIITNVFLYRSFNNGPIWSILFPSYIFHSIPLIIPFFAAMFFMGLRLRSTTPLTSFYFYLICVVTFSSAITNQYLAIPLASIAVLWNWCYALYTIAGTIFLLFEGNGLHFSAYMPFVKWNDNHGYQVLALLLGLGLLITAIRNKRRAP